MFFLRLFNDQLDDIFVVICIVNWMTVLTRCMFYNQLDDVGVRGYLYISWMTLLFVVICTISWMT